MSTYRIPVWTTGERMAKARRDAGLSQAQMADLLTTPERPVSKQTVSNWEKGVNQPRHFQQVLDQWAETTNVSVLWLLGWERPDVPEQHIAWVTEARELVSA
jgi:transcriptional regulator with XRE-family HTH domain